MKIALFGGSFDPVHLGHLAVARSAAKKFHLDLVYFVPADLPPHKQDRIVTDFHHRFAMLALATAGEERFVPSLLDAPANAPNYSVDTVRRLKRALGRSDQLYFLIGIDAFKDIHAWKEPVRLLGECDFIVAARPGHSLAEVVSALPEPIRPAGNRLRALARQASGTVALAGATLHLLPEVRESVSSTEVRAVARKSPDEMSRLLPGMVAAYIKKQRLYAGRTTRKRERAKAKARHAVRHDATGTAPSWTPQQER